MNDMHMLLELRPIGYVENVHKQTQLSGDDLPKFETKLIPI